MIFAMEVVINRAIGIIYMLHMASMLDRNGSSRLAVIWAASSIARLYDEQLPTELKHCTTCNTELLLYFGSYFIPCEKYYVQQRIWFAVHSLL